MLDAAHNWDGIPSDIFHYVLEHATDLSALRLVCKQWAAAVDQYVKRVKLRTLKAGHKFLHKFTSLTSLDLAPQSTSGSSSRIKRRRLNRLITGLTDLKQLKTLKLGANVPLSGLCLTPLTQLQILVLDNSDSKGRGTMLTHITSLCRLKSLSLAGWSNLEDHSLPHLLSLRELQTLRLDDAKITDVGLATLSKLPTLTTLSLRSCVLVGNAGLAGLVSLRNLESLDVCGCFRITDEGLESISELPSLRMLDLTYLHKITDRGVTKLGGLSLLECLSLSLCLKITDGGLVGLTRLTALTTLDLSYCSHITEAGLGSIKALTSLRKLNLDQCCNLACSMVTALQGLDHLTEIRFHSGHVLSWNWKENGWATMLGDVED